MHELEFSIVAFQSQDDATNLFLIVWNVANLWLLGCLLLRLFRIWVARVLIDGGVVRRWRWRWRCRFLIDSLVLLLWGVFLGFVVLTLASKTHIDDLHWLVNDKDVDVEDGAAELENLVCDQVELDLGLPRK